MRFITTITVFVFFFLELGLAYPVKPDPAKTPGELCSVEDRDFDHFRYDEDVPWCRRNVSSKFKSYIYRTYGIPYKHQRQYTIDHFIPLSLGGNNSRENLWPEHREVKQLRPYLEHDVFLALRDGEIRHAEALEIIIDAKMNPPIEELP